jgi:hypothetical protein
MGRFSHAGKCAKAPLQQPDGGALKGGQHEYGERISCHPKAPAHAPSVLPRFGKYLAVSIGGGESYETQSQRRYILDIA